MKNKFDYCVFIGRFSPFHKAHMDIIEHALTISNNLIIVIGSSHNPRSIKNPWTSQEREKMIIASLGSKIDRVSFLHMRDYLYNNNMWVSVLQEKINKATGSSENIALIGFESDETSFYLKLFPQFKYVESGSKYTFHATQIRDNYLSSKLDYKAMVPDGVAKFLNDFSNTTDFNSLKQEKEYIDKYKESWKSAPFPPIFMTVDSLVLKSGHILLVKRGHNPGKGLLALPGGFVNQKEKLQDAALRELKEETGIKINIPDLKKAIISSCLFDDPMRSARGRVISQAFFIDLGNGQLPLVKGGDDAAEAFWLPLSDYYELEGSFFEDHFHIIRHFVSKF